MSEKLKGIFGNSKRSEEVKDWLTSQGAEKVLCNCTYANHIYYVRKDGSVDYMHKNFVELFDIVELPNTKHEFKPFDKVLVKSLRTNEWFPDIVQIYKNDKIYVVGADHPYDLDRVIPYEGNEHLAGTSDCPNNE